MWNRSHAILLALAILACPATCLAGKFNKVLDPGVEAPVLADLPAADGKTYAWSDFADAELLVLIVTCNHCPVSQAYEGRIKQLVEDFGERGVSVVAVSCGMSKADQLEAMRKRAQEQEFNFTYLYDGSQKAGKDYGAERTPTAFVLDKDRKVRYLGAIDDRWNDEDRVKRHYLRDAVEALLEGKDPPTKETKAQGCDIEYEE